MSREVQVRFWESVGLRCPALLTLSDGRYACFFDLNTWRDYVTAAGFAELDYYYRPPGLPRERQPWLATVWRKA